MKTQKKKVTRRESPRENRNLAAERMIAAATLFHRYEALSELGKAAVDSVLRLAELRQR